MMTLLFSESEIGNVLRAADPDRLMDETIDGSRNAVIRRYIEQEERLAADGASATEVSKG